MATSPQCLRWLEQLLAAGELTASTLPKSIQKEVDRMDGIGWIARTARGRGQIYTVTDEQAIRRLLDYRQYEGDIGELTPKGLAVAVHGDAHRGKQVRQLLLLASSTGAVWKNQMTGETFPVGELTSRYGAVSLVVGADDAWVTETPLVLVENKEVLLYADKFPFQGTMLYYGGKIAGRLIEWLSTRHRTPKLVVFPDYDPVGLHTYLSFKQSMPEAELYVPNNLKTLLSKHKNPQRLSDQEQYLSALEKTKDIEVARVFKMIISAGGGLDQEVATFKV
jgi:hypothetical protein